MIHLPYVIDNFVQEIAIVGNYQYRATPLAQIPLKPFDRIDIQMIGGLIQHKQVWVREQQPGEICARALPT